jgi:hypothetical protein
LEGHKQFNRFGVGSSLGIYLAAVLTKERRRRRERKKQWEQREYRRQIEKS